MEVKAVDGYKGKRIKPNINKKKFKHLMYKGMSKLPLGKKILKFLLCELTIIRMIDAANLKRASIDPIANDLFKTCKKEFVNQMKKEEFDKWKQFTGYMIYLVMDANGYKPAFKSGGNVPLKIKNGIGLKTFNNGKKYKIKN